MSKEKPTPATDHEEAPELSKIDTELAKSLVARADGIIARGSTAQEPNEFTAGMTPSEGFDAAHGIIKKLADDDGESIEVSLFQTKNIPRSPKFAESMGTKVTIYDDGAVDARQEHWVPDNLDPKVPPEPKGKFDVTPMDADAAAAFVEEQLAAHQALIDSKAA